MGETLRGERNEVQRKKERRYKKNPENYEDVKEKKQEQKIEKKQRKTLTQYVRHKARNIAAGEGKMCCLGKKEREKKRTRSYKAITFFTYY